MKTFSQITQCPVGTCASSDKDFFDFEQDPQLTPLFSNQAPSATKSRQLLATSMSLTGLFRSIFS